VSKFSAVLKVAAEETEKRELRFLALADIRLQSQQELASKANALADRRKRRDVSRPRINVDPEQYATAIRNWRCENGLSQSEAAAKFGICKSLWSNHEFRGTKSVELTMYQSMIERGVKLPPLPKLYT
jgi:ribosome-binding protein aMBF1 (putative translation factor)